MKSGEESCGIITMITLHKPSGGKLGFFLPWVILFFRAPLHIPQIREWHMQPVPNSSASSCLNQPG